MIVIRDAMLQDAQSIAQISTDSLGYPCDAGLVAKRLQNLDTQKQRVFVAVEDDLVVGFVHAEQYQLLYYEDLINILGLAVSKQAQGKGCGKKLMQSVEQWAKELHCAAVRVNSGADRTGAHCFYEKLGYQNTKSQKRFLKDMQ